MFLRKNQRYFVRSVARGAYLDAGFDKSKAIEIGKERLKSAPASILTTILISLAVRLLVALITDWVKREVEEPGVEYSDEEPGYSGFTETDTQEGDQ